jgi:hypothetical protein
VIIVFLTYNNCISAGHCGGGGVAGGYGQPQGRPGEDHPGQGGCGGQVRLPEDEVCRAGPGGELAAGLRGWAEGEEGGAGKRRRGGGQGGRRLEERGVGAED